ncbi:MAG: hypothetical protein IPJ61_10265 [Tessaracoccus sp.]|uniref:hypothetical protein n=1 Tax=Tessaracoccus sp. TaxID=1971211 RepID=UPI001ED6BEF7|nr:hypothetical protein [Tessaracoccus sp.]MBK7821436.1 hypothetical protein [Tessaracoccus sp.]
MTRDEGAKRRSARRKGWREFRVTDQAVEVSRRQLEGGLDGATLSVIPGAGATGAPVAASGRRSPVRPSAGGSTEHPANASDVTGNSAPSTTQPPQRRIRAKQ